MVGLFRRIAVTNLPATLTTEGVGSGTIGLMATTGPAKVGAIGGKMGGFHVLIDVVIVGHIAGLFGFLAFHLERFDDGLLDQFPAACMNWVGDVSVKFGAPIGNAQAPVFVETTSTGVAKPGPHLIFEATTRAAVHELSAGHGHKKAFGATNDFKVPYHEGVVKGDRAETQEAFVFAIFVDKLDPDFSDVHSADPPWNRKVFGRLEQSFGSGKGLHHPH